VTLATLEQALGADREALPGPAESRPQRSAALAEFAAAGLPTTRRENWRYTDLKTLANGELDLVPRAPDAADVATAARVLAADDLAAGAQRLVFVDGHPVPALSTLDARSGVEVVRLESRWERFAADYRTRIATTEHPLATLNTAYSQAGTWLRVPDGVRVATPVHVVLVASGLPNLAPQPRLVIELGRGAELTVVQQWVDADDTPGWINSVTQVDQAADSRLSFYRVQQHGTGQTHTSLLAAELAARASLSLGFIDLGGRLVRNDIDVKLREIGAAVELFGAFLAAHGQHVDDHTRVDHLAPDTRSDEAFRGLVGRRGRFTKS